MRFEKLSEDKIRITLSSEDLAKKHIDFHSFMSNSIESQDLFFDMLDEAEKEIGFSTKDYLIRIEALAMAGGDFVLTVTRALPKDYSNKVLPKRKVHIKRKSINTSNISHAIYNFSSFDDYCNFIDFYASCFRTVNIAKKVTLYEFNSEYYLVLDNINSNFESLKKLFSSFTEFATFMNNSDIFESKLVEKGKIIMKHNAISSSLKFFAKKT